MSYSSLIVKEILINGYLEMSSVVMKVVAVLATESGQRDPKSIYSLYVQVRESFERLANESYIERLQRLESSIKTVYNEDMDTGEEKTARPKLERIPKFANNDEEKFSIPTIKIDG